MLVLPLHIHTRLQKLTFFVFFPNGKWKILTNVQKRKNKKTICCPMLPVVVSFFPLFFWEPFPNVIFDIPEVSAF